MSNELQLRIGEEERAGIAEAERLVKEAEFGARELGGWSFWLAGCVALTMTAFQVWTAARGTLPGVLQRSVHLAFAIALGFMFYPAVKTARYRSLPWYDLGLAAVGVYAALYVTIHHTELIGRVGSPAPMDIVVARKLPRILMSFTAPVCSE